MTPSHLFSVGDIVVIFRITAAAGPSIEGRAVVKDLGRRPCCYEVQFFGELRTCERSVHRVFQQHPEKLLAAMRDVWRSDNAVAPFVSDFFPDQHSQSKV